MAAADGDLHIYAREEAGEWSEVLLSEDLEQIDQDGGSILEALYERYAAPDRNGQAAAHDDEQDEPRTKRNRLRTRKSATSKRNSPRTREGARGRRGPPEDEGEPADKDDEPADQQEKKPRRSRARPRVKKK